MKKKSPDYLFIHYKMHQRQIREIVSDQFDHSVVAGDSIKAETILCTVLPFGFVIHVQGRSKPLSILFIPLSIVHMSIFSVSFRLHFSRFLFNLTGFRRLKRIRIKVV